MQPSYSPFVAEETDFQGTICPAPDTFWVKMSKKLSFLTSGITYHSQNVSGTTHFDLKWRHSTGAPRSSSHFKGTAKPVHLQFYDESLENSFHNSASHVAPNSTIFVWKNSTLSIL